MSLARRSLMEAAAARFGWRRAYCNTAPINVVLTEQTENAYLEAADHVRRATEKNKDSLHIQPGVLDVRDRVLTDVLYLEVVLTGAKNRSLPKELIERLEDVVDHGHELTLLLAEKARTTAAVHAPH
ncbi:hypothetical protein OG709_35815 (plasmid) [Streptomyces sp. NBC_01267]|uniref:hypothetical protein n=1 Tax=Streptomyces sp. NBC_01267 TaxID=2903805 RepID=UPI002E31ACEC|nr:hypothetical protein [Streptomyces sp. NBC_01267]